MCGSLTDVLPQRNVGMTGEVDARGQLLEVGGIKEKAQALAAVGVTTMLFPAKCGDVDLSSVHVGGDDAAATVEVRERLHED